MAGLLYKDFIAVKGKTITLVMLSVTLFLVICSLVVTSDNFFILAGALMLWTLMALPLTVPMYFMTVLFGADAGKKKKAYLFSLPVNKKQYVASKYAFILIAYYVIMSWVVIISMFMNPPVERIVGATWFVDIGGIIPLYICVCLIISAVEMPFFVVLGVKAGNAAKTLLLAIGFFVVMGYLLFGDLSILDRLDLAAIVEYLQAHPEINLVIQSAVPFTTAIVYYVSYRISSAITVRRELQDEE